MTSAIILADRNDIYGGCGMPLTEWAASGVQVTTAPVGISTRVTDFAGAIVPETLVKVGEEQGYGFATYCDTALASLFTSFTVSVGTTNTAITADNFLAAIAALDNAKVPVVDRCAILSPGQYTSLLKAANVLNPFAMPGSVSSGALPVLFGVECRMSQVLGASGAGSCDRIGALFQKSALGFAQAGTLLVEVNRAPVQYRATDIGTSAFVGVGLIDAARGVKIVCAK